MVDRFAPLLRALDTFRQRYGEGGATEPWVGDADMVPRLVRILERGEALVIENHEFIIRHSLYADGMFWFDAFAVAHRVCGCIQRENAARYIPRRYAERLVLVLARMTTYRVLGGPDIMIRGDAALSAAISLFGTERLIGQLWSLVLAMDVAPGRELGHLLRGMKHS